MCVCLCKLHPNPPERIFIIVDRFEAHNNKADKHTQERSKKKQFGKQCHKNTKHQETVRNQFLIDSSLYLAGSFNCQWLLAICINGDEKTTISWNRFRVDNVSLSIGNRFWFSNDIHYLELRIWFDDLFPFVYTINWFIVVFSLFFFFFCECISNSRHKFRKRFLIVLEHSFCVM